MVGDVPIFSLGSEHGQSFLQWVVGQPVDQPLSHAAGASVSDLVIVGRPADHLLLGVVQRRCGPR